MKRKLISMLMIGVMVFSMVACGDKDKETSSDGSSDTAVEENENDETETEDEETLEDDEEDEVTSNVKKTPMTEDQKFEHNKKVSKELLEFFKQNNIYNKIIENKEDGSEFWVEFDQEIGDMTMTGRYRYEKGVILQATMFVKTSYEKSHKGTAVIDIDKTIVPKIYDIITGTKGKSYEKYREDLNKISNNALNDNPNENIPTTFEEHIETEKFGELIRIADGTSTIDIIFSAD